MSVPGVGPAGRVCALSAAHGSRMQAIDSVTRRSIGDLNRWLTRDVRLESRCDKSVASKATIASSWRDL
jgi:hypothetical protein